MNDRPTTFQALQMTRGMWKRGDMEGEAICPVCGRGIVRYDHARMSHLRSHLNAGWRPASVAEAAAVVAPAAGGGE